MKSFLQYLSEAYPFRRADKITVPKISTLPLTKSGDIEFITYHGGNFGEKRNASSDEIIAKIDKNPTRRITGRKSAKTRINQTPNQPEHSFMGLSTTPDAFAAREYRLKSHETKSFVANPKGVVNPNERLYQIQGRVKPENLRSFSSYDDFDSWYDATRGNVLKTLYNDKKYVKMQKMRDKLLKSKNNSSAIMSHDEKMGQFLRSRVHRHITDELGIHAAMIGTDPAKNPNMFRGSGRAKLSGEIMLFKPQNVITNVRERGREVDASRQRIGSALERLERIKSRRK